MKPMTFELAELKAVFSRPFNEACSLLDLPGEIERRGLAVESLNYVYLALMDGDDPLLVDAEHGGQRGKAFVLYTLPIARHVGADGKCVVGDDEIRDLLVAWCVRGFRNVEYIALNPHNDGRRLFRMHDFVLAAARGGDPWLTAIA